MEKIREMKIVKRLMTSALVGALALSACSSAPKPTEIKITEPVSNTEVRVGQSVVIQGNATGEAIARVDVIVDGVVYATLPGPAAGVPAFPVKDVPWTATAASNHAIVLKAYGPKPTDGSEAKLLGQSEPVIIVAKAAVVPPTPTPPKPTAAAIPTQAPQTQPVTSTNATTNTSTLPATPVNQTAGNAPGLVVTNEFVNVRKGPGVGYEKIGELKQNENAAVKGRNSDSTWFQIAFQNGVGWVISDYVQPNTQAKAVPVAVAPPLPVQEAPVVVAPAQPVVPLVPLVTQAPVIPPTPAPAASTVGSRNVLRINANPVAPGSTVYASWNIPNFREGSFDRGDGQGFKGPVAQAMTVDVPGVGGQRTVSLKWKDTSGAEFSDSVTIFIAGQPISAAPPPVQSNPDCNSSNPDWRGSNSAYTFCTKQDLEYVTPGISNEQSFSSGEDRALTVKWNIYGINGLYLKIDGSGRCGLGAGSSSVTRPLPGAGETTFNVKDLAAGAYKVSLEVVRKDNVSVRYNEKFICITGGSSGGGGGGGGGGVPTPAP
jgi:uncharacterized protein YraI